MEHRLSELIELSEKSISSESNKGFNEYKIMLSLLEKTIETVSSNFRIFKEKNNILDEVTEDIKYDSDKNKYIISLLGTELRGNLGNIYNRKMIRKTKAHQISVCKWHNMCGKVLSEKYCKFYHDSAELEQLLLCGKISDEYFKETIKLTRNFTNTAWIYSSDFNQYMRNFGNKADLDNELCLLKERPTAKQELEDFKAQLTHDILILYELKKHNLL
jgi:hypothetical protein